MNNSKRTAIVGCKIFEDEIAYLINKDQDIEKVMIQRNDCSKGIKSKLDKKTEIIDLKENTQLSDSGVVIEILPLALHEEPEELRKEIKNSVEKIKNFTQNIFLFYGLCGNALNDFEEFEKKIDADLTILRKENKILDDCICLALNGNKKYLENVKEEAGTFFLTPMWAKNWRDMFEKCNICKKNSDLELIKYVFDKVGYKRALKLNTGLGNSEEFEEKSQEFAEKLDLVLEEKDCSDCLNLLEKNYFRYKENN